MAEDKELAEKVEQAKQVARQELLEAREVLRPLDPVCSVDGKRVLVCPHEDLELQF